MQDKAPAPGAVVRWWEYCGSVAVQASAQTRDFIFHDWRHGIPSTLGWLFSVWLLWKTLGFEAALSEVVQRMGEFIFTLVALPGFMFVMMLSVVAFQRHERQKVRIGELEAQYQKALEATAPEAAAVALAESIKTGNAFKRRIVESSERVSDAEYDAWLTGTEQRLREHFGPLEAARFCAADEPVRPERLGLYMTGVLRQLNPLTAKLEELKAISE
jgi:hypothetical protein